MKTHPMLGAALTIFVILSTLAAGKLIFEGPDVVTTTVKFTSSPIQVRFFKSDGNGWSEWQDMPFPGGKGCQTDGWAEKTEIRPRSGLGGVKIEAAIYGNLAQRRLIKVTESAGIMTVAGTGRIVVSVGSTLDSYSCQLTFKTKEE